MCPGQPRYIEIFIKSKKGIDTLKTSRHKGHKMITQRVNRHTDCNTKTKQTRQQSHANRQASQKVIKIFEQNHKGIL